MDNLKSPAQWREAKGLSQDALAEKAGIVPNSLAKVENGDPHVGTRTLRKIAKALGIRARVYADAYFALGDASNKRASA